MVKGSACIRKFFWFGFLGFVATSNCCEGGRLGSSLSSIYFLAFFVKHAGDASVITPLRV